MSDTHPEPDLGPGRAHPMPIRAYLPTIQHMTGYACLYIRDVDDRPIQLRSVYTGRPWQLPGGNIEPGESPWDTAVREAAEETGLNHFRDLTPELILTHYLHPEAAWPMPKVGFVFNGGHLTAQQLKAIRLQGDEHSHWAAHTWETWQQIMGPRSYTRLRAIEHAHGGTGPRLLLTHAP